MYGYTIQSWAHATTVATIRHRFKANKWHITSTYCAKTPLPLWGANIFPILAWNRSLITVSRGRLSQHKNLCKISTNIIHTYLNHYVNILIILYVYSLNKTSYARYRLVIAVFLMESLTAETTRKTTPPFPATCRPSARHSDQHSYSEGGGVLGGGHAAEKIPPP